MNIHEYQSKELFKKFNVPILDAKLAKNSQEARLAAQQIDSNIWVVKAQVHAGGRGKAGGVKLCQTLDEVESAAKALIGSNLETYQSIGHPQPVHSVLVESGAEIEQELYLSALIDRKNKSVAFIISASGGMDIEEVSAKEPEKIMTIQVEMAIGLQAFQARKAAFFLGLSGIAFKQFVQIMQNLYQLFIEKDLSLLEINPLILTKSGDLFALDGKINIDDNALYRHQDLKAMYDPSQENQKEVQASKYDLNYVSLDGNIACMVNGAGLAMATMDIIQISGGKPANFLDVGGTATAERVTEAFKIIRSEKNIQAILVNIFGGIVRCNLIAQGIIQAVKETALDIPLVVRLEGTNAKPALEMLNESGLSIITAPNLQSAAEKAVEIAST